MILGDCGRVRIPRERQQRRGVESLWNLWNGSLLVSKKKYYSNLVGNSAKGVQRLKTSVPPFHKFHNFPRMPPR